MRRRKFLASTAAMTLASGRLTLGDEPRAQFDANWPAFRGRGASGVADGHALPTDWTVRWKSPVPGLGHSSPIVWGDRVYVASAVSAMGEQPLKLGLFGDRDAAEETGEQSWVILCFDKHDGRLLWDRTVRKGEPRAQRHMKATQANTTLATDGRVLVSFFGSEGLYCHTLDGATLWEKDLGTVNVSKYGVGWGYASSPAIDGDRIVLLCDAPDDPYLACFSLIDGAEFWRVARRDVSERSWATPFVHHAGGRSQVVANAWPYVVGYDLANGAELWRMKAGGDNPVPTPFAAHGLIYVANGHGASSPVSAIRPEAVGDISLSGNERSNQYVAWCDRRGGSYIQTPLVYGDLLYSATNNGIVKCYDAVTGDLRYQERLGNGTAAFSASPVAGDGKVYFTGEEGDVYIISAKNEFEELAKNSLGDTAMATPAISEGVMYFRTRQWLLAVG